MPLKRCTSKGQPGWKWGNSGKCYTGPGAKKKAIKQGIAMGEIKSGEEATEEEVVRFGMPVSRVRRREP